jgi:hypothetical protein
MGKRVWSEDELKAKFARIYGNCTFTEAYTRDRAWAEYKVAMDQSVDSPQDTGQLRVAVDCGEAKTPNFRDSKSLSVDEKLRLQDIIYTTAISRAVKLGKSTGSVPSGTLERLEIEIDSMLSKDTSNTDEVQKLIDKTRKLLANLDSEDRRTRRQATGLTSGRWDADKQEWTTNVPSTDEDVDGSGLTVGRWDPEKKEWVK